MKNAGWWIPAVASLLLSAPQMATAKASPEEAAKLGKELTPVGAERVGNKAGTIPEWSSASTPA